MNKNAIYLAVFAVLCVLAGVLVGAAITRQTPMPFGDPGRPDFRARAEHFMGMRPERPQHGGKKRNGDHFIKMLITKLELNEEQKVQVKNIVEKTRTEIDAVGKNIRTSMTMIREQGDREIMAILTPEQQKKFKNLQDELKRSCPFKRPHGAGGTMEEQGPLPNDEFPPPPPLE